MSNRFEFVPNIGITIVNLSDSLATAHASLVEVGNESVYDETLLELEYASLKSLMQSLSDRHGKIFQIISESDQIVFKSQSIVGQRLDDALEILQVRTFEETLWSAVDIESEVVGGKLIKDSNRPRKSQLVNLVREGTLWIKPLGLGLALDHGFVTCICIRRAGDVPRIGCGKLTVQQLEEIISESIEPAKTRQFTSNATVKKRWLDVAFRTLLIVVAILLTIWPGIVFYREHVMWSSAIDVTGVVESKIPEDSPFPDHLVVRYVAKDDVSRQVQIPVNFTTAREVQEHVILRYLPHTPENAMTPLQARLERFWNHPYFPYLLCGSLFLAVVCVSFAFPNWKYSRRNRRVIRY